MVKENGFFFASSCRFAKNLVMFGSPSRKRMQFFLKMYCGIKKKSYICTNK